MLPATLFTLLLQAPIPPAAALEAFGEYEEAALADGGELWGRELLGPLLFADPRTRTVVANQPDEQNALVEREGVFVGTLPPEVGLANTALTWSGVRWTMVLWPLPAEREARVTLLLHEAFHRVQPSLPHAGGSEPAAHLEREDARVWLRLEWRALARALRARGDEERAALADALLFRTRRHELYPAGRTLEASLERNEGLAEYTGLRLCGVTPEPRAERAALRLLRDEAGESFVRSFAYACGPAYGLLLDRHAGAWQGEVGATSELAQLLARALVWQAPAGLAEAAEQAARAYDVARVRADEQARAQRLAARVAELRARYVDGPVLRLAFGAGSNYTFDPNDVLALEGLGTFYGSFTLADDWGVLTASGGALVEQDAAGRMLAARVPVVAAPSGGPRTGPGWSLSLAPDWTLALDAAGRAWSPRPPDAGR